MEAWRKWVWAIVSLFGRNWITLFGATLTTISFLLIVALVALGFLGIYDTPYIGIMAFLILPGVFILGLVLIPVGIHWGRESTVASEKSDEELAAEPYPKIDFNKEHVRRMAGIVSVLTAVNLLVLSIASYKGVVYMETVAFCGTVCHTVMEPEYAAYMASPHARVACVECHIGPGAPWFVRSKLSGLRQVFAVTFKTYERPIPTPVDNLRPSRDTCEQCHWPERFTGNRIKVITKFAEDEANTQTKTVLLMHIGGGNEGHGGIHSWHIDPRKDTTYIATDRQRQNIAWVQVRESDGTLIEFTAGDAKLTPEQIAASEKRSMDCIDCHNRPTHIYKMPDQAIDEAMARGQIDPTLPYIKKIGVEALRQVKGSREEGLQEIAQRVRTQFQGNDGGLYASKRDSIEKAIREIQAIYSQNVFPKMNVTWGTHSDNLGHERFKGCFRCHEGEHTSKDGKTISNDCGICHTILAMDEQAPEVLKQLEIQ